MAFWPFPLVHIACWSRTLRQRARDLNPKNAAPGRGFVMPMKMGVQEAAAGRRR